MFFRQILLPEVGEAGQARILEARAAVGGEGLAHEVASLYARRAGFSAIDDGSIAVDDLAPRAIVKAEAARDVLAGARAALAAMRACAKDPGA